MHTLPAHRMVVVPAGCVPDGTNESEDYITGGPERSRIVLPVASWMHGLQVHAGSLFTADEKAAIAIQDKNAPEDARDSSTFWTAPHSCMHGMDGGMEPPQLPFLPTIPELPGPSSGMEAPDPQRRLLQDTTVRLSTEYLFFRAVCSMSSEVRDAVALGMASPHRGRDASPERFHAEWGSRYNEGC